MNSELFTPRFRYVDLLAHEKKGRSIPPKGFFLKRDHVSVFYGLTIQL